MLGLFYLRMGIAAQAKASGTQGAKHLHILTLQPGVAEPPAAPAAVVGVFELEVARVLRPVLAALHVHEEEALRHACVVRPCSHVRMYVCV